MECAGYSCDCDYVLILRESKRKARKSHKCFECKNEIGKGQVYTYTIYIHDGKFWEMKICPSCQSLIDAFFSMYSFGNLWNEFWDHVSDGYEYADEDVSWYALSKVLEPAKTKAMGIIEKIWARIEEDEWDSSEGYEENGYGISRGVCLDKPLLSMWKGN